MAKKTKKQSEAGSRKAVLEQKLLDLKERTKAVQTELRQLEK